LPQARFFCFSAALPVVDADLAKVIRPDVLPAITYLSTPIYGYVFGIFAAFHGIAVVLPGYLIFCSSYLPRAWRDSDHRWCELRRRKLLPSPPASIQPSLHHPAHDARDG
jgi:hypothetical protein